MPCPIELKLKYFNMRYWLLKLIHFMTLVSFYTLWKPQKIRVVLKFWGLGTLQACNFIKKRLQYRSFPVNFAKLLRTSILKNICQRLLLNADSSLSCHKGTKYSRMDQNFTNFLEYFVSNIAIWKFILWYKWLHQNHKLDN